MIKTNIPDATKKPDLPTESINRSLYFDDLLPDARASVFLLARIAMNRALEINGGSKPLVKFELTDKETSIALREIAEGKVAFGKNDFKKDKHGHITKRVKVNDVEEKEDQ